MSSAYMKSSKDRETLVKLETEILKSKELRMELLGIPQKTRKGKKRKKIILYKRFAVCDL